MLWRNITNALFFFYIILLTILICIAFSYRGVERTEKKTYNGFDTKRELQAMRYLHEYHGTLSSEDGYFYRDGERCSLWDPRVRTDM